MNCVFRFRQLTASLVCLALPLSMAAQESGPDSPADSSPAGMLTGPSSSDPVSVIELVDRAAECDVIVLGEIHNNDAGHRFQLDVIRELVDRGDSVAVSMEQFERDVQGVVDDYLAGRIDEATFLENSRPWKNYDPHYRPIVEFAKQHKLPILAGNVPRRLAGDVADDRPVDRADSVYMPRSTTAPQNAYWDKFRKTMEGHGGIDDEEKLMAFYRSQCLKDDAMAEAITDYLDTHPHQRKRVVHLCGHFHSDYGLGTVARVRQRRPLSRAVVVTMESEPESGDRVLENGNRRAHFVFWTPANPVVEKVTEADASENPDRS